MDNAALIPVPNPRFGLEQWTERHERFCTRAKSGDIDVLFLGDSITDYWRDIGERVWNREFVPLKATNFGITADRIQHLLWRLQNGEMEGFSPRTVVLLVGANNTGPEKNTGRLRNSTIEVVEGISHLVDVLAEKWPRTYILVLALFPLGKFGKTKLLQINEVNLLLSPEIQKKQGKIGFADLGHIFLLPDGNIDPKLMPDFAHPSEMGYEVFARELKKFLSLR
jgi:lysophospholipase L1-like esterase